MCLMASLDTLQENLDAKSLLPMNSLSSLTSWSPEAADLFHPAFHMLGPRSAFQSKALLYFL